MRKVKLESLSVRELVARFAEIGVLQDETLLMSETAKFNRLYDRLTEAIAELKRREGDQRRALLRLYRHPNAQVRLNAAHATLALEPEAGRRMLQAIKDSREFPQAADAGMSIRALDQGIFKPT